VKKALFIVLCTALLMSCGSNRAAVVDSTITEAKVLQNVAKANGEDTHPLALLISEAEKAKEAGQSEKAYFFADEAVLRYQIALLKRENKGLEDSLRVVNESLEFHRSRLDERQKARR
jgi:ABC-type amino acid transport substrate-binding protein